MPRLSQKSNNMLFPNKMIAICLFAMRLIHLCHCQMYPIVFEMRAHSRECFELNIPDGDDTHLLFLALNTKIPTETEDWYIQQMAEVGRHESPRFLQNIDRSNEPDHVVQNAKNTREKSYIAVKIELIGGSGIPKTVKLNYFELSKLENLAGTLPSSKDWDTSLGQYSICFDARGRNSVRIVFESIVMNEYMEKQRKKHTIRKEHLTPVEKSFEEGIALAHSLKDEMYFMEKRETRMKRTTDQINKRLKVFSYLSVIVLLAVTYFQITYLKSYFKKKKVL